jgi:hypothetical protein
MDASPRNDEADQKLRTIKKNERAWRSAGPLAISVDCKRFLGNLHQCSRRGYGMKKLQVIDANEESRHSNSLVQGLRCTQRMA